METIELNESFVGNLFPNKKYLCAAYSEQLSFDVDSSTAVNGDTLSIVDIDGNLSQHSFSINYAAGCSIVLNIDYTSISFFFHNGNWIIDQIYTPSTQIEKNINLYSEVVNENEVVFLFANHTYYTNVERATLVFPTPNSLHNGAKIRIISGVNTLELLFTGQVSKSKVGKNTGCEFVLTSDGWKLLSITTIPAINNRPRLFSDMASVIR